MKGCHSDLSCITIFVRSRAQFFIQSEHLKRKTGFLCGRFFGGAFHVNVQNVKFLCVSSADAHIVGIDNKDVQTWDSKAQLILAPARRTPSGHPLQKWMLDGQEKLKHEGHQAG